MGVSWVSVAANRPIISSIYVCLRVCVFVEGREREERVDNTSLMVQKSREYKLWEEAKAIMTQVVIFVRSKKLTIRRPSTRKRQKIPPSIRLCRRNFWFC